QNSGAVTYTVYKNGTLMGTTANTTYTVTGLTKATSYTMTVVATDAAGNESEAAEVTATTAGGNLLPNGGFETYTGSSGAADGWSRNGSDWSVVTTPVAEGTRAQRIGLSGLNVDNWVSLYRSFPVSPGKSFVLDGQFNASALNNAKVQLNLTFMDANGNYITEYNRELFTTTDGYVTLKIADIMPANAVEAEVNLRLKPTANNGTGTMYVDGLRFRYFTPTIPGNLHVTGAENTSVDLDWDDSTQNSGAVTYTVYKNGTLMDTTANTNYTVTGLTKATSYTMTVVASDAAGNESEAAEVTATTAGGNMLPNGGFETYTGSSGAADGWNTDGSDWSVVTTPVMEGTRAQRIGLSGLGGGHYIELYRDVAVTAGKSFALDGQFNAAAMNHAKVQLNISFYNANDNYITEQKKELLGTTDGYVPLKTVGTVPANAVSARIGIRIYATEDNGTATLYADKLSFRYFTPTLPGNLHVTGAANTSVDLDWDASTQNSGAVTYTVYKNGTLVGTTANTTYTVTGLTKATSYTMTVVASDAAGNESEAAEVTATTAGGNLLVNGSFETENGWTVEGSEFQRVTSTVYQGQFAQKLKSSNLQLDHSEAVYQMVMVDPLKPYSLSTKLNVQNLTNMKLQMFIDFYDAQGNAIATNTREINQVTNSFVSFMISGKVPTSAVKAFVTVRMVSLANGANGEAVIDNMDLHYQSEVRYIYNSQNRLDYIIYSDGTIYDFEYDNNGNLKAIRRRP
ncbi:fibronectin type III domain-containing protein, partial [Cohnella silvisoli]